MTCVGIAVKGEVGVPVSVAVGVAVELATVVAASVVSRLAVAAQVADGEGGVVKSARSVAVASTMGLAAWLSGGRSDSEGVSVPDGVNVAVGMGVSFGDGTRVAVSSAVGESKGERMRTMVVAAAKTVGVDSAAAVCEGATSCANFSNALLDEPLAAGVSRAIKSFINETGSIKWRLESLFCAEPASPSRE